MIEAAAPETQSFLELLAPAVLSAVVVGIVGYVQNRKLKNLEARLTNLTGFNQRRLEAHEKLWALVQKARRGQLDIRRLKNDGENCRSAALQLATARRELKNFVFDNGLYFDEGTRDSVIDLDKQLGNPKITNVSDSVSLVESKIRDKVQGILRGTETG